VDASAPPIPEKQGLQRKRGVWCTTGANDSLTGEDTAMCGLEWERYLANGGRENKNDDSVHRHGVKRLSCLDDLLYWRMSPTMYMPGSDYSAMEFQSHSHMNVVNALYLMVFRLSHFQKEGVCSAHM
jgi:hypothetical protein